jgi:chromosome segregation ATPase
MDEEGTTVKVAVLEQRVIDLKEIVLKLEEAIERIGDVNANIIKMLAVHEEKINTNQENAQTLFNQFIQLSEKVGEDKKEVLDKINTVSNKVNSLTLKFGAALTFALFIGFVINNAGFFEKMLEHGKNDKALLTKPPVYAKMV